MKLDIKDIKKLRELTGASVMDCRKGLEECQNDLEKAKNWIEKKAIMKSTKKADRETIEGVVAAYVHAGNKVAALVKLVCETDFVARNQEFLDLAHELAMQAAAMKPKDVKELLAQPYIRDPETTIENLIKKTITKFGENIKVLDFTVLTV